MKRLLPLMFLVSHSLLINRLPAKEPADTNYDESKVPAYTLPKLEATSREHWETVRRAEVVQLLEDHVYGQTPRQPVQITATVLDGPTEAFHGTATRRQIQLELSSRKHPDRKLSFEVLIYSPRSVNGKSPAFIGLNFSGNQCVHADPEIRMSPAGGKARGTYASRWQVPLLLKRGYGLVTRTP